MALPLRVACLAVAAALCTPFAAADAAGDAAIEQEIQKLKAQAAALHAAAARREQERRERALEEAKAPEGSAKNPSVAAAGADHAGDSQEYAKQGAGTGQADFAHNYRQYAGQYLGKDAQGRPDFAGDYTDKYMSSAGPYAGHHDSGYMAEYAGDHDQFMSKYYPVGAGSKSTGSYQKYLSEYTKDGDYAKGGGDYQKYIQAGQSANQAQSNGPQTADQCKNKTELRAWREQAEARITHFTPKAFQQMPLADIEKQYQQQLAKLEAPRHAKGSLAGKSKGAAEVVPEALILAAPSRATGGWRPAGDRWDAKALIEQQPPDMDDALEGQEPHVAEPAIAVEEATHAAVGRGSALALGAAALLLLLVPAAAVGLARHRSVTAEDDAYILTQEDAVA